MNWSSLRLLEWIFVGRDEPEVVGVQALGESRPAAQRFGNVERHAWPVREAEVRVNGFAEEEPILRRREQLPVGLAMCVEERARVP